MGVPLHELEIGVTVSIAVTGTVELLLLVNAAMDPLPVKEARPTAGFVFVQLYKVFATADPLKLIPEICVPLQTF
jgi:hypothetical protein